MKKIVTIALSSSLVLALLVVNAEGRSPYKTIVDKMDAGTAAEKEAQSLVKANKCNACHVKGEKKKVLGDYGMKLKEALGKDFKYDKALWKKQDGQYSGEAVKLLLEAVNKTGK